MHYEVIWLESAQRDIARLTSDASLKGHLAHLVHRLQREFAKRPTQVGESRDGEGLRVLVDLPFGVAFQVNADEKTVHVIRIWFIS